MVKGTGNTTEVFLDQERIKVHPRSYTPGRWVTDQSDYPPEKLAFLMSTPTWCRKKAAEFGPHTEALITTILKENAMRIVVMTLHYGDRTLCYLLHHVGVLMRKSRFFPRKETGAHYPSSRGVQPGMDLDPFLIQEDLVVLPVPFTHTFLAIYRVGKE